MPDTLNEVQLLTEKLAHAEKNNQALAVLCAGYHALIFGDHRIPAKDPHLVMRAVAYSFAHAMLNRDAKNFVSQDITLSDLPKHPEPFHMNVTVQRIGGKSPAQLLEELKLAINAVVSAISLLAPDLAETITLSRTEEVPGVVADWLKTHAIACPVDSTAYTQSHT